MGVYVYRGNMGLRVWYAKLRSIWPYLRSWYARGWPGVAVGVVHGHCVVFHAIQHVHFSQQLHHEPAGRGAHTSAYPAGIIWVCRSPIGTHAVAFSWLPCLLGSSNCDQNPDNDAAYCSSCCWPGCTRWSTCRVRRVNVGCPELSVSASSYRTFPSCRSSKAARATPVIRSKLAGRVGAGVATPGTSACFSASTCRGLQGKWVGQSAAAWVVNIFTPKAVAPHLAAAWVDAPAPMF